MDVTQQVTPHPAELPVQPVMGTRDDTIELTPEEVFSQEDNVGAFYRAQLEDQPESKETVPQVQKTGEAQEEPNDTVRYQYWQSEADKARNENDQLKNQLAQVQRAPEPQVAESQSQETDEGFPPPPSKPRKPAGFNREEAWSDQASVSAQYLETVDNWRDSMDEYNRLHNDYNVAVVQEERAKITEERNEILRKQAEKEKYDANMSEIRSTLTAKYDASGEEVDDFVKVMENPDSINLDNLFQLYRMKNNTQVSTSPTKQAPIERADSQTPGSDNFDQLKRAQQVPSPMGVLPSANKNMAGSPEDTVMDSMINEYDKRNPWT
jgi:hypothetical protein